MAIIQVKELSKDYSSYKKAEGFWNSVKSLVHREKLTIRAVDNVSFTIDEGELVGFLGPNGAGKTTTLKMLSGILYPTSGSATVLGYVPWERKPQYQRQFALVMGQKNQLWWDLPPADSFLLFKEIYEIPEKQYRKTLDELSTLLEVTDVIHVPARKLSLGERMKCELMGALLHKPKVLFLDEPTIGLDLVSQQNIREFLKRYNQEEKTTIVLTSHYMEDIKALAKRVVIIDHGRVIYDDTLQRLTDEYGDIKSITLVFSEDVAKKDLANYGEISEYSKRRVVIDVPRAEATKVTAALLQKLPVEDVTIAQTEAGEIIREIFQGKRLHQ